MFDDDPYGEIQMLVAGLPDSARAVVAKSAEFRERDELDFAIMLLDRAVAKHAAPIIMAERAKLLAAQGDVAAAIDLALEAIEKDPMDAAARRVLARILVDALPDAFEYLVQISALFADEDEPEFAEDLLRSAVQAHPKNPRLRMQLARFYAQYARTAESVIELKALLRIDPDHTEALAMLAAAMLEEGNAQAARQLLDKAKKLGADSSFVAALDTRIRSIEERNSGD